MGVGDSAGAMRSRLHSPSWSKSFASIKKSLNSSEVFYLDDKRNPQRWKSNTNCIGKTIYPYALARVVPWNIDPLLYNYPILFDFLWFLIDYICNLSISLFLCKKVHSGYCWFVFQNWRIPSQNGNLLIGLEEFKIKINLSLRFKLNERSVLIIHYDSWIFCLIISSLVPLSPLVGLRPPSNSFILSFRLTTRAVVRNTTLEGALSMLVLSYSDTHHLNRYIIGCGWHEILISCSTIVLFLSNFFDVWWTASQFSPFLC